MDTNSFVNCCYVNIQSVGNKTVEIREFIIDHQIDILAITETWLAYGELAKIREITPDTHKFLHIPREDRRGGGVGIFISKKFLKIREVRGNKYECFEYIHICFENHGSKYAFIILYRPPESHFGVFF